MTTEGTPPTKAALQATSTIPIVFGSAQDPVEKGIVASLAYPGGNVTGMALIADHAKPLELLKEAESEVSRVVFIYDPEVRPGGLRGGFASNSSKGGTQARHNSSAVASGEPDQVDTVFSTLPADTNGLLLENSSINLRARKRLCQLALQRGLPTMGTFPEFPAVGCLVQSNRPFHWLQVGRARWGTTGRTYPTFIGWASYVDKILKGAKPSDLPVMQATIFDLVINLKTTTALGLQLPAAFIARATDVIE
jgi:putative ABC transport system substrate-binding protein